MPVLKTYTATIGPVPATGGRRASAEDFGASAGLGTAGKAIQDFGERVLDQQENDEARKALIISTELRAKYARELDAAALSGGNMAALKEKMAADFAKIGEDFSTKRGVELVGYYAANTELMYDEQANRIEVQRAAANARLQGQDFLNNAGKILQSSPNALPMLEANAEELVKTFQNLRPEQAAEITEELKKRLNMNAALAQGRVNAKQTLDDLKGGKWNLSPEDRLLAIDKAENEIRAKRAEEAYLRADAERQKRERDDAAQIGYLRKIYSTGVAPREMLDDPALSADSIRILVNFTEQRARALTTQEKASNSIVRQDLWMRIHADETDPRRMYDGKAVVEAVSRGELNTSDANSLLAMVAAQKDENNIAISSKIRGAVSLLEHVLRQDPRYSVQPALAASITWAYQSRVQDKITEYRTAGKNPNDLFLAGNSDFIGAQPFIQSVIDTVNGNALAAGTAEIPVADTPEKRAALPDGTQYNDGEGNISTKKTSAPSAEPGPTEQAPFEPPRPIKAVKAAIEAVGKRVLEAPPPPKDRSPVSRRPERLPGGD